jgi:hypothetical protein
MNKLLLAAIGALSLGAFNSLALAHDDRDRDNYRSNQRDERHWRGEYNDRRDDEPRGRYEQREERGRKHYRRDDDRR